MNMQSEVWSGTSGQAKERVDNIMWREVSRRRGEQNIPYFILRPSIFQRKFLFLFLLRYFLCLICKFEPCLMFCLSFKSNFGKIISTNLCANQFKFLPTRVCLFRYKERRNNSGRDIKYLRIH